MDFSEYSGRPTRCVNHDKYFYTIYCSTCKVFLCEECQRTKAGRQHDRHFLYLYRDSSRGFVTALRDSLPELVLKYQQTYALHRLYSIHKARLEQNKDFLKEHISDAYLTVRRLLEKWRVDTLKQVETQTAEALEETCLVQERAAKKVAYIETTLHELACVLKRATDVEIFHTRQVLFERLACIKELEVNEKILQCGVPLKQVCAVGPLLCEKCVQLLGYVYSTTLPFLKYDVFYTIMEKNIRPALAYLSKPEVDCVENLDFQKLILNMDDLISWQECLLGENVQEIFFPRDCCSDLGYEANSDPEPDMVRVPQKKKLTIVNHPEDPFKRPTFDLKKTQQAKKEKIYEIPGILVEGKTTKCKTKTRDVPCQPPTYPKTSETVKAAHNEGQARNAKQNPYSKMPEKIDKVRITEPTPEEEAEESQNSRPPCSMKPTTILGWAGLGTIKGSMMIAGSAGQLFIKQQATLFVGTMVGTTKTPTVCTKEGIFFCFKSGKFDLQSYIYWAEMTRCYYYFSPVANIIAIIPNLHATSRVRCMCNLHSDKGPYLNPYSEKLKERYIVLHFKFLPSSVYHTLDDIFEQYQELLCRAKAHHVFKPLMPSHAAQLFKRITGRDFVTSEIQSESPDDTKKET